MVVKDLELNSGFLKDAGLIPPKATKNLWQYYANSIYVSF